MKYTLVFVIVALTTIVYAVPRPDDTYTTKYDNIDLDSALANGKLVDNYIACIDETGKCTPPGNALKKYIRDALETCCDKCSDFQKAGAKKVFTYLKENKADKLEQLKAKFDPTGEHEKECREKYNL